MKNWTSKSKVLDTFNPNSANKTPRNNFLGNFFFPKGEGNDIIRKYTPLNKEGREKR